MRRPRDELIPVIDALEEHAYRLAEELQQRGDGQAPAATALRRELREMQRQLVAYDRADPTVLLIEPLRRLRARCHGPLVALGADLDAAIAIAERSAGGWT
jgi:hypothetical protein